MSAIVTQNQGNALHLNTETIRAAALSLPPEQRVQLGEELLMSIGEKYVADVEAAQLAEVERRIASCDESKLIPLDEAMKMAKGRRMP